MRTYLQHGSTMTLVAETEVGASGWEDALEAHAAEVKSDILPLGPVIGDVKVTQWRGCGEPLLKATEWTTPYSEDGWETLHFERVLAAMTECPPGS